MRTLRQKHSGARQTLMQHTQEKSLHIFLTFNVTFIIFFSVQHSDVWVLHQALYWYVTTVSVLLHMYVHRPLCAHILQFLCVSVCVCAYKHIHVAFEV